MLSLRSLGIPILSSALLVSLVACSGVSQPLANGASPPSSGRVLTSQANATLYVANSAIRDLGSVNVYQTSTGDLVDTITNGIDDPTALAVDAAGNLYVANRKGKNVAMYAPGTTSPALTITQNIVKPYKLRFDPAGELNVINANDITVYAAGSGTLLRRIRNKLHRPYAMTFDTAGDLFVLNYVKGQRQPDIVEFKAGSTKVLRTFVVGSQFEANDDLAIGPDGYLYVADDNYVIVVNPANGAVVRTISQGVYGTITLAFDDTGKLYVSNDGVSNGIISVYAPGGSAPLYEIKQDDAYSFALLFDSQSNLYLASQYGGQNNQGMVAEFAPAQTAPMRLIENGMDYPDAATFGP